MATGNREQALHLFERARTAQQSNQILPALRLCEEAAALQPDLPGLNDLRARCLGGLGRFNDALDAVNRELQHNPSDAARELKQHIEQDLARLAAQERGTRRWESSLTPEAMQPIEAAAHRYSYRGHPMIKNPYDIALYIQLLWNLKPQTVFEVGSYNGASALWMSDLLTTFEVKHHIYSLDVVKVTAIERPQITFMGGSGREPEAAFPASLIAKAPRPFLVIEDADHTNETSKAVLNYFHPHMQPGDYFIIEDGLTAEGPRIAIAEFLASHGDEYLVDSQYCDFFGYNATWCVNGFLKRL